MTAYATPDNVTLELKLLKEKDLISISNPKEVLNEEGALKENFLYKLSIENYKDRYVLKKSLEVQAENGQRYLLSPETPIELKSAPRSASYTAIIPAGKKLIKKKGTAAEIYELTENLIVNVTPPINFRVTLQLYPQTLVESIPDPGTSSMGTTLTVEPKRAPLSGYIKLTVKKRDFDFGKAQFDVYLQLHGKDESGKKQFFASDDVELIEEKREEAVLRARIPEKMDGLGGFHLANPVDLLVVASIPGDEFKRTEVMTQEFSVSSRKLAGGIGILAFIIPWIIAALVARHMKSNTLTAAQNTLNETEKMLNDAQRIRNNEDKIDKLTKEVEKQKNALESANARPTLNPIWIVTGKVGNASLSLAQILIWSMLVFAASFYVLMVSGKLLNLTNDVLVLLGFAGGASVIAKITASVKDVKGQSLAGSTEKQPKWRDLITTDGRPDLYKFQMALFTTLAAVFVAKEIFSTLEFPMLPSGLLTLIGISNGVYLTAKASSKTAFEELAELDRERQKANDNLEKLKNEAAKLVKSLNNAKGVMEAAQNTLNDTRQKLAAAEKAKDTNKKAELEEKVKEQEAALEKATTDHQNASNEKNKADTAVKEAQKIFDKHQNDFGKKKKQALE
jgi:hypothetical protein